ncbi:MAG: hypothetical protein Q7R65_02060 [bacterium]|nr:hypothetical protein [bacterium]
MDQNMNGKNKTLGIAIIALVLVGGFLWWSGTRTLNVAEQNVDTNTTDTTALTYEGNGITLAEKAYTQTRVKEKGVYVTTVNYTNAGFVPPIVYIKAGEAVRFVNKDEGAMRIASNSYQDTAIYAGLGQEKSVGTNGKYEFIFTKPGVWGYNNLEKNLKDFGIVYVR